VEESSWILGFSKESRRKDCVERKNYFRSWELKEKFGGFQAEDESD
jgi:hypothetical protein